MQSLFSGKTDKSNVSGRPAPEVAAYTYEDAPNTSQQGDTLPVGLQKAKETLFGQTMKHEAQATKGFESNVREGAKGPATWVGQKLGLSDTVTANGFGVPASDTPMTRPVGVLVSEETRVTGKRYADRPEGLDQFGGEEAEREIVTVEEPTSTTSNVLSADTRRYADRPEGLDQFGGEESERSHV